MKKMDNNQPLYNCSQEDFYVVAGNGFNSCYNQSVAFAQYKASYTPAYIQQQLDSIAAAENMHTLDERNLAIKKARLALDKCIGTSRENWMKLRGYINAVATDATREIELAEAGSAFYSKASKTWPAMKTLLTRSNEYIIINETRLLQKNNMPATFPATYQSDSDACYDKYKALYEIQNSKGVSTAEKTSANNAIYEKLMDMFTDGQCIFLKNEKLKKEFVFRQVLKAVKGAGIAGLKGAVKAENGMPVAGAVVSSADGKYAAVTDDQGRYHIAQVLAGVYVFSIQKPGYQSFDAVLKIEPGVTRRGNYSLVALENAMKVA